MNEVESPVFDVMIAAVLKDDPESMAVVQKLCNQYPKIMEFRRCDNLTALHIGVMKSVSGDMIKLMLDNHADPGIADTILVSC